MTAQFVADPIRALLHLEEIKQLKARYCRFVDRKEWAGLAGLFSEKVQVEIAGGPGGADDTQRFVGRSDFIDALRALMQPLATVHHVHAKEIELLSETRARGLWAVADRLVFPGGSPLRVLQGWGHYEETYDMSTGQWVLTPCASPASSLSRTKLTLTCSDFSAASAAIPVVHESAQASEFANPPASPVMASFDPLEIQL